LGEIVNNFQWIDRIIEDPVACRAYADLLQEHGRQAKKWLDLSVLLERAKYIIQGYNLDCSPAYLHVVTRSAEAQLYSKILNTNGKVMRSAGGPEFRNRRLMNLDNGRYYHPGGGWNKITNCELNKTIVVKFDPENRLSNFRPIFKVPTNKLMKQRIPFQHPSNRMIEGQMEPVVVSRKLRVVTGWNLVLACHEAGIPFVQCTFYNASHMRYVECLPTRRMAGKGDNAQNIPKSLFGQVVERFKEIASKEYLTDPNSVYGIPKYEGIELKSPPLWQSGDK
jgi:hypothetical protein